MYFNPFYPLTKQLLQKLIEEGNKFFVRQTFARGKNPLHSEIKNAFLFSHYMAIEPAMEHYDNISKDPNRFLYDSDNIEHFKKLEVAASKPDGYSIFSNVLHANWQQMISSQLNKRMRNYIESKLHWKPKRGDSLNFNFLTVNGELFAKINFNGKEVMVNFEDIEKLT